MIVRREGFEARLRKLALITVSVFAAAVAITTSAHAVSIGDFTCITNNDAGNCAIGEASLSASLTDNGPGSAILEITMTGRDAAVVKRVFLDSSLLKDASFLTSGGVGDVAFRDDNNPGNLPGGNPVGFSENFSSTASSPAPRNGIGYSNQDRTSGQSGLWELVYAGDFDELAEDLRVGVHVIAFADNGSEAFTNDDGPKIPEPASALVFAIGFGVISVARRTSR